MMKQWRQVAVFVGVYARIIIWRGFMSDGRVYPLDRERAHRIGRLLDSTATVGRVNGELVYKWNDWDWHNIGGK